MNIEDSIVLAFEYDGNVAGAVRFDCEQLCVSGQNEQRV